MKKIHYSLSVSLIAFTTIAHASNAFRAPAADIPDVCKIPDPTRISTTQSPKNPNWFFRSFPNSNKVSFASDDGNYILDMDTNQAYQVPGPYDPVPIGESIISVPQDNFQTYSVAQILSKTDNTTDHRGEITSLGTMGIGGVYQSIGQMPSVGGKQRYRAVTDQDGASYVDMEVDTTGTTPTIKSLGPAKKTCNNADFNLPMLSKDGTEIAGFDNTTQTTKVWKINADGSCTEVLNLGIPTGKADFSFDNKKLVFHVTGSGADSSGYFTHTSGSDARDVYTYDREKKSYSKISQNLSNSAYYPVWRKDGKVVYVNVDDAGNASFVKADPAKAASAVSGENLNCATCNTNNAVLAIGRTWYDLCHNVANANQTSAMVTALSLDADQCKKLVDQYWISAQPYQAKYGSTLTKEVLMAACPIAHVVNSAGTTSGTGAAAPTTGKAVAQVRCAYCHAPGRTQIYSSTDHRKIGPWDFSNPSTIPAAAKRKMRAYIGDGSMPPNTEGALPPAQATLLSTWLR
jgi:mono/diheme cytochrome c family protein